MDINSSKLTNGKDSVSVIDAIATVNKSGEKWAISLVNRHPSKKLECEIKIEDNPLNGTFKARILTGKSTESYNDINNPDRVSPEEIELTFKNGIVNLPPRSLTIVQIL